MAGYKENKIRDGLTRQYLNECFEYVDGRIFWKERPVHHFAGDYRAMIKFNKTHATKEAFNNVNRQHGYCQGGLDKGIYLRRLIIWMMHHGMPTGVIKTRNSIKTDDRIQNLYVHSRTSDGQG